tara:strand:+ start:359 stop:769 length:411 start_codon:yes stop_codon:yes gene_type:complete
MKFIKTIFILIPLILLVLSYKKSEVKEALNGTWEMHFEEDSVNTDTLVIFELKIKNYKVKESLYEKVGNKVIGKKIKAKGSYKFVRSFMPDTLKIVFNGGLFIDQQDYYISKITPDTIYLLSYYKYGVDNVYLIKK